MEWYEMAGLTFILIVFLIAIVVVIMRWFRHRERLAMIERGLVPPDDFARPDGLPRPDGFANAGTRSVRNGKALLIGGIGISALGIALLCAALFLALPVLTGLSSTGSLASLGLAHLPGLFVLLMGIALLILYVWTRPAAGRPRVETPSEAPGGPADEGPDVAELEPIVDTPGEALEAKVPPEGEE